jgi:polyhydroxyalkanoate synthesis regulator phasin
MKITESQLKGLIREAMHDDARTMNPEALRDTARDKIEEIINEFYDDLVEDAGLGAEEAQMQVQEMIDTLSLHARQGFIGMPT